MCLAAFSLPAEARRAHFAGGQVWEYKTRPQDPGSLRKIQRITQIDGQKAYHLNIIGVRFQARNIAGLLPDIPVSEATLEARVTRPASSKEMFPTVAVDDGIQQWRSDRGGIFAITVAEIVELADD